MTRNWRRALQRGAILQMRYGDIGPVHLAIWDAPSRLYKTLCGVQITDEWTVADSEVLQCSGCARDIMFPMGPMRDDEILAVIGRYLESGGPLQGALSLLETIYASRDELGMPRPSVTFKDVEKIYNFLARRDLEETVAPSSRRKVAK